ncbi:MAG: hypothetical protein ACRDWY_00775 [Actinomycetes bacterium]
MKYDVHEGTVRYDDDGGNSPDSTWDEVLAAHGEDTISGVYITAGFSLQGTTDALVNSLRYEVAGSEPKMVSFNK